MRAPAISSLLALALTLHATAAHALQERSCSMTRDAVREQVRLVFDERQQLAGFSWSLYSDPNKRCLLSAETFRETSKERYHGVGGCELQTWRQGNRQTLAVTKPGACKAYCTSQMGLHVLELPIAVDLHSSNCSN